MSVYTYGINGDIFEETTKEFICNYFKEKEFVQFDSETTGFSAHVSRLLCIQLGDYHNQFVIHPDKLLEFKKVLERRILIGHNLKFDLNFLYKQGIFPTRVYDTYLAECVIHCGIKTEKKGLGAVAKKRIDVDLDKSVRGAIPKEGLTKRVIEYAADDVKYLELIRESQLADLERLDLIKALDIENQYVLCLAYIEFCGFKLDADKWMKKHENDIKLVAERKNILDKFVLTANIDRFIDKQLSLFDEGTSCNINWASPKQVIDFFKHLKIPVETVKKGVKKETVEAKHLGKYRKKYEIVKHYLEYKEAEKVVSTYGEGWLRQINPVTGRIHTQYQQVMDTSRLSSGGKDKENKLEYPNLQNVPREKEARECFVPEAGNQMIIGDFSGQESVILTNISLDKNLLDFYDNGLSDMHSFVAMKMYKELAGLSVEEIKEKHADKRYNAKTAGFSINYGGAGSTIANNSEDGISIEEGDEIYNAYFEAFPGLKKYFDKAKKEGLQNGYILMSPLTGRKSFIYGYEEYLELKKEIGRRFWDRWKAVKRVGSEHVDYAQMKSKISKFFKIKGEIERKSLNYPIQGQAAEISKIAGILFFEWLRQSGNLCKILISNVIHDEYVLDCPKSLLEEAKQQLHHCMTEAGKEYCTRVPLKADVKIAKNWAEK